MTSPQPISRYAPNSSGGDRTEFTDKGALENVPLIIKGARTAKGANGVFWIAEAARKDTGEAVVFTGSTVIDQIMAAVKEQNAFPVFAMLVKVQPDTPGANWYWNLVDPPGTPVTNGDSDRLAAVGKFIENGIVTVGQVQEMCTNISEKPGTKVKDLDDKQFASLMSRLGELQAARGPLPEEPAF